MNSYMSSIDLKDAYYLILVYEPHRKFLRFQWKNSLYEFSCLCFGLCTAPRVFTKLLKPIFAILRSEGFISCVYVDDILLLGNTTTKCKENLSRSMQFLERLGWMINLQKSHMIPTKSIKYLGFLFDSFNMTLSLPIEKREKVLKLCKYASITIQKCSEVIGYLFTFICYTIGMGKN